MNLTINFFQCNIRLVADLLDEINTQKNSKKTYLWCVSNKIGSYQALRVETANVHLTEHLDSLIRYFSRDLLFFS